MWTQQDVEREVVEVIERGLAAKQPVAASWITKAVVDGHPAVEGEDADWYRCCAYGYVRGAVRTCLRRYQESPDGVADTQLVLEGFVRVQRAYLTKRDGEPAIVPTDLLTIEELTEKIAELLRMAEGCEEHAKELTRYRDEYRRAG